MSFRLKPMLLPPMFVCYSVFKTYVIEKYVFMSFCLNPMLLSPYVRMLLCLQNLCH